MSLDIIRSPLLGDLAHGFFGRAGGVSGGIHAGLNCGLGSQDDPDAVRENRARVAQALGARLASVSQVHSARVVAVTEGGAVAQQADALVTDRPGVALTILTADCQPVLFADPEAGVIGAAHAGWKGAIGGVLEATLAAMERLGARPGRTRAVIGPTISQAAYEVGPDFFETVLAEDPEAERFFAGGTGDRMQFDLPGYGLMRLRAAGVEAAEWTRHCTYGDPARFFSYRRSCHRSEADYGRLIAGIALPSA